MDDPGRRGSIQEGRSNTNLPTRDYKRFYRHTLRVATVRCLKLSRTLWAGNRLWAAVFPFISDVMLIMLRMNHVFFPYAPSGTIGHEVRPAV